MIQRTRRRLLSDSNSPRCVCAQVSLEGSFVGGGGRGGGGGGEGGVGGGGGGFDEEAVKNLASQVHDLGYAIAGSSMPKRSLSPRSPFSCRFFSVVHVFNIPFSHAQSFLFLRPFHINSRISPCFLLSSSSSFSGSLFSF